MMSDDGAQLLEDDLILLERGGDLVGRHPRVGIKTFGAQLQPLALRFFHRTLGDARPHLGKARTQARQPFGAQSLQWGTRKGFSGFSGFSGFCGFSGFSRFCGFSRFSGFCGF